MTFQSPYITDTHEMTREAARQFADRIVAPQVDEIEANEDIPRALFRALGEAGYLTVRVPESEGGAGSDLMAECLIVEEMSRACCGVASAMMPMLLVSTLISRFGTSAQKERYLPGVARGELVCSIAITEPGAGSDVGNLASTARRDGDTYVLNGSKTYITNGPDADFVVLLAATDKSAGPRGFSLFIIDKGTPGFGVARKMNKVGNRASKICELFLSDCVLPADALLGGVEGGFRNLLGAVTNSRVTFAARSLGVAQAALDASLEHADTRRAFGKSIGQFQAIHFKLADMATNLQAARLMTHQAAWMSDQGHKIIKEAAMAKLYASERAVEITSEAVQIHGGYGYMMEAPIQRYWRDARLLTISEGTSEIQRQTIAKQLGITL